MAIVLSCVSLTIAILAFVRSVRGDRRKLLFELHSAFIAPSTSAARAELHRAFEQHGLEWHRKVDPAVRSRINAALSQCDAIAFQVQRGHVDQSDSLMLWGPAFHLCWERSRVYVESRRDGEEAPVWSWFSAFADRYQRDCSKAAPTSRGYRGRWWNELR